MRFLSAYCFGILIFIVASLPGSDLEKVQNSSDSVIFQLFFSDHFMHFLTFGILTFLIYRGYKREAGRPVQEFGKNTDTGKKTVPYTRIIFIPVIYGIVIEFYQDFLPYRSFGLDDIMWNSAGAVTSVILLLFIRLFTGPVRKYENITRHTA